MKNQVYYGEYSLAHWMDLLEKNNITIPDFQREFVWKNEDIENIKKSFDNDWFVPPIIIGKLNNENIIIDGQQRLSSIYLLKQNKILASATANWKYGDTDEDKLTTPTTSPFFSTPDEAQKFLESKFLGFSYIVPSSQNEKNNRKYFVEVFKRLNTFGIHLAEKEVRNALFYLYKEVQLKNMLHSNVLAKFKMNNNTSTIDYIRLLGYLNQYHKHKDIKNLLEVEQKDGTKDKNQEMYNFIEEIGSEIESSNTILNLNISDYKQRLNGLNNLLNEIYDYFSNTAQQSQEESHQLSFLVDNGKKFDGWTSSDMFFLGLINSYIFEGKEITIENIKAIIPQIKDSLSSSDTNDENDKKPNTQKNILERIKKSIEIYGGTTNGNPTS